MQLLHSLHVYSENDSGGPLKLPSISVFVKLESLLQVIELRELHEIHVLQVSVNLQRSPVLLLSLFLHQPMPLLQAFEHLLVHFPLVQHGCRTRTQSQKMVLLRKQESRN